jgi:sec-independent protein translocase protein TatA
MEMLQLPLGWLMGGWELAVVGLVAFLLFGHRLPTAMRSLGLGIGEFKKGMSGIGEEEDAVKEKLSDDAKRS